LDLEGELEGVLKVLEWMVQKSIQHLPLHKDT
jgi:hypothetical protein